MDYNNFSYDELKELRDKIEALMQERRQSALQEFQAKAQSMGLDIAPIFGAMNGKPKFRDGNNTWSGRGKRPRWLIEKLEAGHKIEDFTA